MVKMNKETEYEKDLNEMKEQILKEGDTLLTKRDLLERFCEIDKEYNGGSWNLLQIFANINILIGQEPCEDIISKKAVLDKIKEVCFSKEKKWVDFRTSYGTNGQRDLIIKFIESLQPVQSKQKTGHWIYDKRIENWKCSECGYTTKIIGYVGCAEFMAKHFKFCNHCGARMVEPQESEKTE